VNQIGLPRLQPRDPHEEGRTATPLELFFDLVFVVAVALASQNLHHFESEDHFSTGVVRYLMVFFAIWWAWMNFTWFASAYDGDDWLYRFLTLVQMAGALIMAAGIPDAMNGLDFTLMVLGYIVMRIALVAQWLRAAHGDPEHRQTTIRYAIGIAAVQVLWVGFLLVPESAQPLVFVVGVACELAVPAVAERSGMTTWHPHHIAERYGLFTMIVLGESILASTLAIVEAVEESDHYGQLIAISASAFVIVACMWWVYFAYPQHRQLDSLGHALQWGYGHYAIFASAAAFSAGIEVALDYETHHTSIAAAQAAATTCVPVAVFMVSVWWLMVRPHGDRVVNLVIPGVALLAVVAIFAPYSLQVLALLMVAGVALIVARTPGPAAPAGRH
jgi:low temperature requirement protein LtrA